MQPLAIQVRKGGLSKIKNQQDCILLVLSRTIG